MQGFLDEAALSDAKKNVALSMVLYTFLPRFVLFYVSFIVRGWVKHVSMVPEVSAVIEGFVFRLGFHVFMSPCVDMQAFVSFAYEFPE